MGLLPEYRPARGTTPSPSIHSRHLFGTVRYETTDTSKNNWFLALLTLGEGWHNNHHHYMAAARQGFFWWEVGITYYVLKAFSWLGLVWDLRQVPAHLLHSEEREQELAA